MFLLCNDCEVKCYTVREMKEHLWKPHKRSVVFTADAEKHGCSFCDQTYRSGSFLRKHMRKEHGATQEKKHGATVSPQGF